MESALGKMANAWIYLDEDQPDGTNYDRVIVKSGVWPQAALLSDRSFTLTPSLNLTPDRISPS